VRLGGFDLLVTDGESRDDTIGKSREDETDESVLASKASDEPSLLLRGLNTCPSLTGIKSALLSRLP